MQVFQEGVDYLGHYISAKGVEPNMKILEAIQNAPRSKDKDQLCSFLWLVEYYAKFSDKIVCLQNLLKENNRFVWDNECESSFELIKK